ncbi:MAG TPA: adenine phosphoribosyltransferase [Chloroflexi bacterium]|jgi:adenine phosphoribosyltransferase|nr:adenine phosphoribosyltransferase [Chloroflexota bacterium]HAL27728.1 adenine phosphoribosyltransferase [Chloroflexota bacterium]
MNRTHHVEVAGLSRDLPIITVPSGVRLAVFNILGDIEMTKAAGKELARRLRAKQPEVIVTTETKSVPLAYEIASLLALPYVVLRKTYVSYMGEALETKVQSITTGHPRTIFLDAKDRALCAGKRVAIVDDVVSTGSTLSAMRDLMGRAGARIVAEAAVFTEGEAEKWKDVVALGHLPLIEQSK